MPAEELPLDLGGFSEGTIPVKDSGSSLPTLPVTPEEFDQGFRFKCDRKKPDGSPCLVTYKAQGKWFYAEHLKKHEAADLAAAGKGEGKGAGRKLADFLHPDKDGVLLSTDGRKLLLWAAEGLTGSIAGWWVDKKLQVACAQRHVQYLGLDAAEKAICKPPKDLTKKMWGPLVDLAAKSGPLTVVVNKIAGDEGWMAAGFAWFQYTRALSSMVNAAIAEVPVPQARPGEELNVPVAPPRPKTNDNPADFGPRPL